MSGKRYRAHARLIAANKMYAQAAFVDFLPLLNEECEKAREQALAEFAQGCPECKKLQNKVGELRRVIYNATKDRC